MNDCDALLRAVMAQAAALAIPFSPHLDPHVVLNARAATRFGCCKYRAGRYTIEVARRVADGPEASCRETLAHELLHTCPRCRDHGALWQGYARKMNAAYGYRIARTATDEALGVAAQREPKYILTCADCGATFPRLRASPHTDHPERYRCKCGGTLTRIT